ncbi:MAG: DUF998 domain-containing protein [bacterium]|nr:DUF998 domain-containing protein [bacterium]
MHISKDINTFTNHYPYVGPISWILCVQYFIVQLLVAGAWNVPHSWTHNTISDLGNTVCGPYNERLVCSPLYTLMNLSFIVLGISMAVGSALIYYGFKKSRLSYVGFSFMALAGIGTWIVGAFPENTVGFMHGFGAALPFLFGNLSLLILGYNLDMPKLLRYYTLLSGITALIALVFFVNKEYLIFGLGGMERIVAYPQTIWMIAFGIYVSANRYRKNVLSHK